MKRLALLLLLATTTLAQSDAKQSFTRLKTLEGTWEGAVTTTPKAPEIEGKIATVTLRVTSMGNVLMHEMTTVGRPDDPITMFFVNEDNNLALTHYCDAGNRPTMTGKLANDRVDYELAHVSGGNDHGHMHGAAITFVDADRHVEEWTYMLPNGKSVRATFDLRRKK
jgi:hypothetical protein